MKPTNHELESRYCFHLYANADFARYSNRMFRRTRSASVIDIPQVHRERRLEGKTGDHFVFAKNIDDPLHTEEMWQRDLSKLEVDVYMMAVETLKSRIAREAYVEMHDVLDDLIAEQRMELRLDPEADATAYHQYHRQLDRYMRSHKSIAVVSSLREFPVHIYGRGWDRIAQTASGVPRVRARQEHGRQPGALLHAVWHHRRKSVQGPARPDPPGDGQRLRVSVEREPRGHVCGHRAIRSLFFSFRSGELPEKCAGGGRSGARHQMAHRFGVRYHDRFHFRDFVNRLDHLAKSVPRF